MFFGDKTDYYSLKIAIFAPEETPFILVTSVAGRVGERLKILKMKTSAEIKHRLAVRWRAFRIWQQKPHEVAPLSEQSHICSSCATQFTGNYCPRCGQSAAIGRFSFKKAILLFLDVWGIGNRSMFRSIRDLMLRPGYMIRDYLRGMQSAYFPPFKMFFLLAAFSLVMDQGLGLAPDDKQAADKWQNVEQLEKEEVAETNTRETDLSDEEHMMINGKEITSPVTKACVKFLKMMNTLRRKNAAVFSFLTLVLFSIPMFFFLRSNPKIPDLRFSEFIVALVYTSNAYTLYSILGELPYLAIFDIFAILIVLVALKQLTGYRKRRLLGYMTLSFILFLFLLIIVISAGVYIIYLTS